VIVDGRNRCLKGDLPGLPFSAGGEKGKGSGQKGQVNKELIEAKKGLKTLAGKNETSVAIRCRIPTVNQWKEKSVFWGSLTTGNWEVWWCGMKQCGK